MAQRHYRKQLNLKLAIALPVAAVLIVGGVYLVHGMQVRRTAEVMLRKAEQAEADGDMEEAIKFYQYYVRYQQKDDAAFCKLALLMADQADEPGASAGTKRAARGALEIASTRDPDNMEVLRELADLSYELNMPARAMAHFERLRQHDPDDSALGVKLARCQIATDRHRAALSTLERVIANDRHNVEAYSELAGLLGGHLEDRDRADSVLNQMISANPKSPDAYVARARFHRQNKDMEKARADIHQALELNRKSLNVLLAAAELAVYDGQNKEAKDHLDQAQALYPDDERVYEARARVSRIEKDLTSAEADLRKIGGSRALFALISVQLQKGDVQAARETMKKMKKSGFRPELLDFFEAQALIIERQWRRATYLLEKARPDLERIGDLGRRVDLLLALCYEQLGLPDRQLVVHQRLLDHDPSMVAARLGYASALLRLGQAERAIIEFRKIRNQKDLEACYQSATLRASMFRLLVADAMRAPEAERDWTEVEEFLDNVEALEDEEPIQLVLMRADELVKQGKADEARQLVEKTAEDHPNSSALLNTLVALVSVDDGPEAALALVDRLKDRLGGGLSEQMVRIGLAARMGGQKGREMLAVIAAEAEDRSANDRAKLWERLGIAYYLLGDRAKASEVWGKAADAPNTDPRIHLARFELAREMGDKTAMVQAADSVRESQGSRSAEWNYCEAARLVWLIQRGETDEKSLVRAKQYLQEAAQARPNWHKLLLLEGEIAVMEGRPDDAIRAYQEASRAGRLDSSHLGQLVQLLYSRGRFEEAKEEMDKLGDRRLSPTMDRIRVELDERTGDLEQALNLAADTVKDSNRPTDFLWYGHLLARAERYDEAEKAFRKCTELGPQVPDGWLALVAALTAQQKTAEAEQVVREAQIALPEDRTPMVLAHCYELLGQFDRAEQQYLHAVAVRPDDLALLRRVATFYQRLKQPEKAAKYLNDMIQVAGKDPEQHQRDLIWARRSLARALAVTGDYRHHRQALRLLDQNAESSGTEAADLRLKAAILAKRPEREARKRAVEILESLRKDLEETGRSLSPEEQFLLAQLHDSLGNWLDCQQLMLDLLARDAKDPRILAAYVDMLFRHGTSPRDVKVWVSKLESAQPDAPATIAAKARLLVKLRQPEEAVKTVLGAIPRPLPRDQLVRLRDAAALLEELGQIDAARDLYKEFAEKAAGGSILLAGFLSRHGTVEEALAQCEAARGAMRVESILGTAVSVLREQQGRHTPEQARKVEGWIQQALDENPQSKFAQLQLARLLDIQGRYDELIRVYRTFLARDDLADQERAAVWNNLAFVLAAGDHDGQEALEMADQALAVLGPVPNVLDTRAIAYLALGKGDPAVQLLREAISDSPSGLRYFHLALAHSATDDLDAAARAIEVGRDAHQLSIHEIPEIERAKYKQLMRAIESL